MHPMLALLATQPHLLVDHAQACAALLQEEFGRASTASHHRALLHVGALCFLGVTTVHAGVALMLWVTLVVPANAVWVLVAIPVVTLLIALGCLLLARKPNQPEAFANLSRQMNADMALLRAAGKP